MTALQPTFLMHPVVSGNSTRRMLPRIGRRDQAKEEGARVERRA